MKHGTRSVLRVAAGLACCGVVVSASAIGADNPYQAIVERNVFALKPPPPPPDPNDPVNKPPPSKITLCGITTIIGKKALLKTPAPPPKPGEPAKTEQSYILGEGQREGGLEVLTIDMKTGTVTVRNDGQEQTLTFEKDGPKLAAGPPPGSPPGAAPASSPNMPRSIPMPGQNRSPRFSAPVTSPNEPAFSSSDGGLSSMHPQTVTPITEEEHALGLELLREATKDAIQKGRIAPPPLTRGTPRGALGTPEAAGISDPQEALFPQ